MRTFLFLTLLCTGLYGEDFPAPKNLTPADQAGLGIQRTMQLLAGSTPEKHNAVRILFYGQSITEQDWTKDVTRYLKESYPNADLTIENRAIGGHSSPLLVKTAEADLYPFQPDLLIFHVYGAHDKYEDLIRAVREKTCAEVLIQTDHLSADQSIDEETDPSKLKIQEWGPWFNYVFLPSLREKYQVEVIPQRDLWKQYLRDYQLKPADLLRDNVHLNPRGVFLMGEIVKSQLRVHPEISPPASKRVVTTRLADLKPGWQPSESGSKLTIPFEGSRIDAIMAHEGDPAEVEVRIDGKKPSEFPTTFAFTRVTAYDRSNWPCLLRVNAGATPLVPETWTVKLKDADADYSHFRFSLSGSVTGPDGEGDGTADFTSSSGRIHIEPGDWNLNFAAKVFKAPHPDSNPITFKVVPLHVDSLSAKPAADRTREAVVTLAQNLPTGPHMLTLRSQTKSPPPIDSVRAYDPGAK